MAMTFVCSSKMDLLGSDATQLYNRMSGYNSLFLAPLLLLLCSFRSPLLLGILSFIFKLVLRIDVPFRWYLGPQILVFSLECSDRNCGCILGTGRNFWNGQCLTLGKAEKALQDKRCRYIFLHCCGCNFFHQMKIFCNVQFFREIARKYREVLLGWIPQLEENQGFCQ